MQQIITGMALILCAALMVDMVVSFFSKSRFFLGVVLVMFPITFITFLVSSLAGYV